jgi:hypothetical protein
MHLASQFFIVQLSMLMTSLKTSTDPDQQFSAPFNAGYSREVQTCYKPTVQTQRKLQHFLVCTGTGETGVLMTLKH